MIIKAIYYYLPSFWEETLASWPWKPMLCPLTNGIWTERSGCAWKLDGICFRNDCRQFSMSGSWFEQSGWIIKLRVIVVVPVCCVLSLEMKVIVNYILLIGKKMLTYCRRRRLIDRVFILLVKAAELIVNEAVRFIASAICKL